MNWSWLTSPLGITVLVVVILVAAALVYWKREPIRRWLRRWKLSEVEVGPVKFKAGGKAEPPAPAGPTVTPASPPTPAAQPTNVVVGSGAIDASTHDRHDVHIQAGRDVAYGEQAGVNKPASDRRK